MWSSARKELNFKTLSESQSLCACTDQFSQYYSLAKECATYIQERYWYRRQGTLTWVVLVLVLVFLVVLLVLVGYHSGAKY